MEINSIKAIKVLPLNEMCFLKKINLENTSSSAIVCYARKLADNYKLTAGKKAKGNHLFWGYKEEEYPCDELDRKILEQIREKFPNATVQTSLMMMDVERHNNAQWAEQYQKEKFQIIVEYIPSANPTRGSISYKKDLEVLYTPMLKGRQKILKTNLCIITSHTTEYDKLHSLLEKTYATFSTIL